MNGRMVALVGDAFGGFGGISKFNRDFLKSLAAWEGASEIHVLPRIISGPLDEAIPQKVLFDRASAKGKATFVRRALTTAFRLRSAQWTLCLHLNLLPLAVVVAGMLGSRLGLVIHGIEAWRPRTAFGRSFVSRIDSVISVSKCSAERFSAWSSFPAERCFILPNSVDLDEFVPARPDPGLKERYNIGTAKTLLTLGRLETGGEKGFDRIIEILPRLRQAFPDIKYLIVGDGADRAQLEAKAKAAGLGEHVIFAGRIPDSSKVAHYNLADAYVMPSLHEGFGIALIEAAACGVPIVGSRLDGSREALLEGALGRLVDPNQPDEIADAIISVLGQQQPHARLPEVETFSVPRFRARVEQWATQCG